LEDYPKAGDSLDKAIESLLLFELVPDTMLKTLSY
jgi:hypothetical protein